MKTENSATFNISEAIKAIIKLKDFIKPEMKGLKMAHNIFKLCADKNNTQLDSTLQLFRNYMQKNSGDVEMNKALSDVIAAIGIIMEQMNSPIKKPVVEKQLKEQIQLLKQQPNPQPSKPILKQPTQPHNTQNPAVTSQDDNNATSSNTTQQTDNKRKHTHFDEFDTEIDKQGKEKKVKSSTPNSIPTTPPSPSLKPVVTSSITTQDSKNAGDDQQTGKNPSTNGSSSRS